MMAIATLKACAGTCTKQAPRRLEQEEQMRSQDKGAMGRRLHLSNDDGADGVEHHDDELAMFGQLEVELRVGFLSSGEFELALIHARLRGIIVGRFVVLEQVEELRRHIHGVEREHRAHQANEVHRARAHGTRRSTRQASCRGRTTTLMTLREHNHQYNTQDTIMRQGDLRHERAR